VRAGLVLDRAGWKPAAGRKRRGEHVVGVAMPVAKGNGRLAAGGTTQSIVTLLLL
jgi:hypothetical protein